MGARKTYHRWTDEERAIVRARYRGTGASAVAIASSLGVSRHAVKSQAVRMGLGTRATAIRWSPQEVERLRQLLPTTARRLIAKRLGKSENAVLIKAHRIGLSARTRDGWYTKKDACQVLGVDHHWLQRRIDDGSLKASWHHGRRPGRRGQCTWHIKEKDLVQFIRTYPQELTGRNIDLVAIVDMLAGIAPATRR